MAEWIERGDVLGRFRRHRLAVAGLVALACLSFWVVAGPVLLPYGPNEIDLEAIHAPPSGSHWLGTDALGRDLVSRSAAAGRVSLLVGLAAMGAALAIGAAVGTTAGLAGGRWDNAIMRGVDVVLAVPPFFVLLILSSFFRDYGLGMIITIIGLTSWMPVARLTRAVVLQLRGRPLFEVTRGLGLPRRRVIARHLVPNAAAPLVVAFTLGVGQAILIESALSFLGFGLQPPTASWGAMLTDAQQAMLDAPWVAVVPGVLIFVTVLCINFIGDGLRDALNPQQSVVG